jgi:hypothetical protein
MSVLARRARLRVLRVPRATVRSLSDLLPREVDGVPANPVITDHKPTPEEEAYDPQLAGLGYPQLNLPSRQFRSPYGWWNMQERWATFLLACGAGSR